MYVQLIFLCVIFLHIICNIVTVVCSIILPMCYIPTYNIVTVKCSIILPMCYIPTYNIVPVVMFNYSSYVLYSYI